MARRPNYDDPVIGVDRDGTLLLRDCKSGDIYRRPRAEVARELTPLERWILGEE